MKTYYFWVTLKNKAPMKVAEDGRTASEAKQIVEARHQWLVLRELPLRAFLLGRHGGRCAHGESQRTLAP